MEKNQMDKIIDDFYNDANDIHNAWDKGQLQPIEAIIKIKNIVLYLTGEFFRQR